MKIMDMICNEIEKIESNGITNGNIDVLYKLIDMKKDLVTIEGMEGYSGSGELRRYDEVRTVEREEYGRDSKGNAMHRIEMAMHDGGMNQSDIDRYMRMIESI